jgi:uncharacterized protein (TIGR02466 family)
MIRYIFPIPIYEAKCDVDLVRIIEYLEKEPIHRLNNCKDFESQFGQRSEETYLLNKQIYGSLKSWIESQLKIYAVDNLGWNIDRISITQSWISIKHPGQGHQPHKHPNSVISGVFYWQEGIESMYFRRPNDNSLFQIEKEDKSCLNEYEEYKPQKYSLVLFPSYLEHFVGTNHSNRSRYCLPFNSMVFGRIGNERTLNELILN